MKKGNIHEVNIPSAYDSFPDSFLLNTRDICQMMSYTSQKTVIGASKDGSIPSSVGKQQYKCRNGVKRAMFRLGDFRKLKEYRDLGLTYQEGLEQDKSPYISE